VIPETKSSCSFEERVIVPWTGLDEMSAALPFVREQFPTCQAYGTAGVDEILGDRFKSAQELQANWFQSTVFLNRGAWFEVKPLPFEAQVAPAFGVAVGDMDGDGREDLFLSQNFFGVEPQTSRHDAGRGVWLKGDGRGNFVAVPGQESGIKLYGEQRGCALCDYDGDGRLDLVVSQNGASTKLYHNEGAKPGLRVRLIGTTNNPAAVGAVGKWKTCFWFSTFPSAFVVGAVEMWESRRLWARFPRGSWKEGEACLWLSTLSTAPAFPQLSSARIFVAARLRLIPRPGFPPVGSS